VAKATTTNGLVAKATTTNAQGISNHGPRPNGFEFSSNKTSKLRECLDKRFDKFLKRKYNEL